ncbi:cytochrome C biogenesis protein [Candidatus Marinamargulisbacteria bacterium SCGC AG-343-D04]|nr:cytochrome C biogenesis protein [Candidatus Marinamargulisbacteria bacterium SCGC AG-343-D04]
MSSGLESLPVLYNGRLQPFDSVARHVLISIQEKTRVTRLVDTQKEDISPSKWLWGTITSQKEPLNDKVFLIRDPDIKHELTLTDKDNYFSFNEISMHLISIQKKADDFRQKDKHDLNAYENNILKLSNKLNLFSSLFYTFASHSDVSFFEYFSHYEQHVPKGLELFNVYNSTGLLEDIEDRKQLNKFNHYFKNHLVFSKNSSLHFFPNMESPTDYTQWKNTGAQLLQYLDQSFTSHPILENLAKATQYEPSSSEFHSLMKDTTSIYKESLGTAYNYVYLEYLLNTYNPFIYALYLYVLIILMSLFYYLIQNEKLFSYSKYLCYAAFLLHTIGLGLRMLIQGRPPVTNLYSSAIFIGWVGIILAFIQEKIFKHKIGYFIASILGSITLIIAYHLSFQSDTLEQMQAVLDSNFWLSTHVVTITLGYSGTYLAGLLGTFYILYTFFKKSSPVLNKELYTMVYGIICFSLFFSFIGTVLGGIWADQSWGRFWGWDPKENGALLIVLWNAIILHSRLAGIVKERGLMLMVIFGNIVTSFSWFGVNMLGVGLHSYGFMESAFNALIFYCITQFVIILIGVQSGPPEKLNR